MIDIKTLQELVRLMADNDLTELDLRDGEETVTLKRGGSGAVVYQPSAAPMHFAAPPPPAAAPGAGQAAAPGAAGSAGGAGGDDGLLAIESPMVGTFYSAADPDSPPFISPGKPVKKGDVVCLIEAMKVFNEIKAEVSGIVERSLVDNGKPVEYGQRLFLVRPS